MDLDRLRPVIGNPNWVLMEEYLRDQRSNYLTRLVAEEDTDSSMILRGRIRELDTLLRLPSQLKNK